MSTPQNPLHDAPPAGRPAGHYDAVVVGARVAGASTALLLARAGRRVLVVDRGARGADTRSSHALMRGAVLKLARWGVLGDIAAAGTPMIRHTTFTYGPDEVRIPITPHDGVEGLWAPRRTVLDPILVAAAEAAGAEFRHGTRVQELVRRGDRVAGVVVDDGSGPVAVTADIVVGADGMTSSVGRMVDAPFTRRGTEASAYVLSYVAGLEPDGEPLDGYHWGYVEGAGCGYIPTNDGLTCVFAGIPRDRFAAEARGRLEQVLVPLLAEVNPRLAEATARARVCNVWGFPGVPGFFRRSHGPGWALVGDAGHWKDPYAAHGISDALRDAELLAEAIEAGDVAGYEADRDRIATPLFETLEQVASYDWNLPSLQALHLQLAADMTRQITSSDQYRVPVATGPRRSGTGI